MQLQVLMMRNGKTEAERGDKLIGVTDEPLSDEGRRQVEQFARAHQFPFSEQVYSSNLLRCIQTVDIAFPDIRPTLLKNLRAQDYGEFEGLERGEVRGNPQFMEWAASPMAEGYPGGESPHAFGARCVTAFQYIVGEMSSEGVEKAAVVSHQSVINYIVQRFCVPRNIYHYVAVPYGRACLTSFNTADSAMKILKVY